MTRSKTLKRHLLIPQHKGVRTRCSRGLKLLTWETSLKCSSTKFYVPVILIITG